MVAQINAKASKALFLAADVSKPEQSDSYLNKSRLDTLYADADTKRKREIIGSMYPEKLTFDGIGCRT